MHKILRAGLAGLALIAWPAGAQEVANIGVSAGNDHYGSVRGWDVFAGRDHGRFRYCYAAVDRDGNGDDLRIGYGSGQWQIAVPVRARPDWYGQLSIDGHATGASGTADRGWAFAWIGLGELDALRAGHQAILSVEKFDVDFDLAGVTAATLMVEECVERRGEGTGGGYQSPSPVAAPNPPPSGYDRGQKPRRARLDWIDLSGGHLDRRTEPAGNEANGEPLYVCSAVFNNGVHPGKLRPGFGGCVVGYGGREYTVGRYSALLGRGHWRQGVPAGEVGSIGVNAGREANGSLLYVCRAPFNNGIHPGKIGPSTGGCNITYGGVEHTTYFYEVLTP
ncbi:DUF3421 domain-containing protein [Jiella endophytica]|uniref:DUF3421 domain-containing protein n=1 Tax=Jiella endophytica TaxID=2558362 RepID=A0A4Y8R9T1_9HYPH|nr:DUF3421 domain-containing protein [Jiella endophytica]TFF17793.1 DUF3421 domain-containing protein [Jiella endophytica]